LNPRLKRPLLTAVVSGALLAGGAVYAGPAFAGAPVSSAGTVLAADPSDGSTTTPAAVPATTDPHTDATTGPATVPATTTAPGPVTSSSTTSDPGTGTTTGTGSASTPTSDPTTAPADTSAPKGGFSLNTSGIWVGQKVTLTQVGVSDEPNPADQITRVVNWGDGHTSTLVADQSIAKQYTVAKTYTITLTLTDAAGNHSSTSAKVAVTVPGKLKLSPASVYPGQVFTASVTSVPAGTTKIYVDWGDGYVDSYKGANLSIRGYYYHRKTGALVKGAVTIKLTFVNKYGATSWISAGKVTVKTDSWKPTIKVTKPSKSNRIGSWKYIRGTASDKGSGAPYAYVWATRVTGKKVYCYTSKKTWKQVTSDAQYDKYCLGIPVKISKGKWSLKLNGLKTGTLYVDSRTWDWADNASKWSSVKVKITRK
jgi:hypothetical protein